MQNSFGKKVGSTSACLKVFRKELLTYSTVRSATIDNKPVAVIYRLVQLGILTYIIGFDIIWNKGYQTTDIASSTVTTKVKGLGYVYLNPNETSSLHKFLKEYDNMSTSVPLKESLRDFRIFDTSDYIVPPNEYNSIFIMSNYIESIQTPSICDESEWKLNAKCTQDSDCFSDRIHINTWNGMPTGRCINSSVNKKVKVCEIVAWCPVERDPVRPDQNIIRNTRNYTIFVKNDIEFKKFQKKERNIIPSMTNLYIATCRYHPERDPYCPVFIVGDILEYAEPDRNEQELMLRKGGIIEIEIIWKCDYDLYSRKCFPKYSFKRFDVAFKQTSASSGFNFRFSNKYIANGKEYRTLWKAYGLRFIINVNGIAGKFNILPLMLTIGAGVGLLTISDIVADYFMLNFTRKRKIFQKVKKLDVNEAEKRVDLLKLDENAATENEA